MKKIELLKVFAFPVTAIFMMYAGTPVGAESVTNEVSQKPETDVEQTQSEAEIDKEVARNASSSEDFSTKGSGMTGEGQSVDGNDETPKNSTENETVTPTYRSTAKAPVQQEVTAAYIFKSEDKSNTINIQVLKNGQMLSEPEIPSKDGYKFTGWLDENNNVFTQFGTVSVSEEFVTTLHASYVETNKVSYVDRDNRIIYTEEVEKGKQVDLSKSLPVNVGQAFIGWSQDKNATVPLTQLALNESGDITLYGVVVTAHWITFDSKGGSTVNPQYVQTGNTSQKPSDPTRAGYIFFGWYSDDALTQAYVFNQPLSQDVTVYAKWKPATTSFKIIFWQEQLTENQYDYVATQTESILTGTTVNGYNYRNSTTYKNNTEIEPYFHYDHANTVTVLGDGTSVVHVYFKRNIYKFKFNINNSRASIKIGGQTYSGNKYSFEAKYGQDVSTLWPTANNMEGIYKWSAGWFGSKETSAENAFKGWHIDGAGSIYSSKRFNVTSSMITDTANGSIQMYTGYWNGDLYTIILHYLVQPANGSADLNSYQEITKYNQTANTDNQNFEAKEIDGYKKNSKKQIGNHFYFYYDRMAYDLSFYNGSNTSEKTAGYLFGMDISNQNYTPKRPSNMQSYYDFKGWYTTSDCLNGSEFDFTNAAMPSSNLALYAKWEAKQITVTYNVMGGSSVPSEELRAGFRPTKPTDPTKADYRFAGWTKDGQDFNFNTVLTNDTTLTARWITINRLHVLYDANGGHGMITDDNDYINGSQAEVRKADGLYKDFYHFIGWSTTNNGGVKYRPEDILTIGESDITLYAVWIQNTAKNQITMDTVSYEGTYDGKEHTIKWIINGLPSGWILKNKNTGQSLPLMLSKKDVGIYRLMIDLSNVSIFDGHTDVSEFFDFGEVNTGTIRIKPAELIIKTGSSEKMYDGQPLTNDGIAVIGLVNGETVTFKTNGSQTNVGSSENGYEAGWNGTAQSSNYTIAGVMSGTLKVTPADFTKVKVNDPEDKVYNGQEQKWRPTVQTETHGVLRVTRASGKEASTDKISVEPIQCEEVVVQKQIVANKDVQTATDTHTSLWSVVMGVSLFGALGIKHHKKDEE